MSFSRLENRYRLMLLAMVAAAQLAVPAWMILARERTLHRGEIFRFRTAPVDPYDAFRGRYVALAFDNETARVPADLALHRGEEVFVTLERDAHGFAELGSVSRQQPPSMPYLRLPVNYTQGQEAHFDLPFDRYYMNERLAPEAERAHRQSFQRGEAQESYVEVRIYRGRAVLEELFVAGRPAAKLVREGWPGE